MAVDEAKLEQFMGQVVSDWAAIAESLAEVCARAT